ncbi:MAG TPA: hypothetical protein VFJ65_08565 [Solirubrobacterales bacterium]|nr:hypothetical protein [Solirubrobacterales bacterium]
MKRLGFAAIVTLLSLAVLGPGTASATVGATLCKANEAPCSAENLYPEETFLEMSLKPGTSLIKERPFEAFEPVNECQGSELTAIAFEGGVERAVSAPLSALSYSECGNCTTTVIAPGRFVIEGSAGTSGKVTWKEFNLEERCGGSPLFPPTKCIWTGEAKGTIALAGGSEATLRLEEVEAPLQKGCTQTIWTAEYVVNSPQPLFVVGDTTRLCKTASSPCTESYEKGTKIKSALKSGTKAVLKDNFGSVTCEESEIAGELTSSGTPVEGTVSSVTFAKCNCPTTSPPIEARSFTVRWKSGNDGSMTLPGVAISVACSGAECVGFAGVKEKVSLIGSNPAVIKLEEAPFAKSSGAGCGTLKWTAEYEVTEPKPLYVSLNRS